MHVYHGYYIVIEQLGNTLLDIWEKHEVGYNDFALWWNKNQQFRFHPPLNKERQTIYKYT